MNFKYTVNQLKMLNNSNLFFLGENSAIIEKDKKYLFIKKQEFGIKTEEIKDHHEYYKNRLLEKESEGIYIFENKLVNFNILNIKKNIIKEEEYPYIFKKLIYGFKKSIYGNAHNKCSLFSIKEKKDKNVFRNRQVVVKQSYQEKFLAFVCNDEDLKIIKKIPKNRAALFKKIVSENSSDSKRKYTSDKLKEKYLELYSKA